MGKEKRARTDGGANHGGTPYKRPFVERGRGSDAGDGATGLPGRGEIQASSTSLQALAGQSGDSAEQSSLWRAFVATPMKALKKTYSLLSGSPNQQAGAEAQDGASEPREASSTAAVVANDPQDDVNTTADRDDRDGASTQLDQDMRSPSPPQGVSPAASGAPPAGGACPTGDRVSSYDDIRAQSASLMAKTPISSSPFLKRQRPGSGQPSGVQLGQSLGPPGRLSLGAGNLSRFAQLESMPAASPLALTPIARGPRTTPRASRPFSRTPVRMPLAWDSNEVPFASTPQQEPTPLTWTPMRAQTMTPQTGGFRGFGLKRMREGDGEGPPGTPLLQAGQASEAYRVTRQRSDKAVGSAERRVWRAGATPFPGRLGSADSSSGGATLAPSRLAAASRDPVPMTESARRIAQALDSMTRQAPLMDTLTPAQTQHGPPPTDSLGAFPVPPAFSQGQSTFQHKPVLLGPSASSTPQPETTARFTAAPSQTTAGSMWGLTGTDSEKPAENPEALTLGAWGQYTQPAGVASGAGSSSISAPSWGKPSSRSPSFGKTAEPSGQHNAIEMPKFNFRPPRPLTDSAEKLRLEQQRQKEAGMGVKGAPLPPQPEQPASRNAAALNAKAEAAAAQPLPDSDDSDDDALGDVKGIMRTGVPKENGTTASKQSKEETKDAAPAASGWGADFLKSNAAAQASQSEAIAKEIADKKSGSTAPSLPSFGKPFLAPGKDPEAESAPSKPEPAPAVSGWGAAFLKKNKESEAKANAAVAAEIEEQKGGAKAAGAPASIPWTFGKQVSEVQSAPQSASTSSGLVDFLSGIAPQGGASGFAPSMSSGLSLGAMATTGTAASPASSAFPALNLPSGLGSSAFPTFGKDNGAQDGIAKKAKRGRAGEDANADGAPVSTGFNFGLPTPTFLMPGKTEGASDDTKASNGFSMPSSNPTSGASQPFASSTAGAKTSEGSEDVEDSQPSRDKAPADSASPAAASQPASMPIVLPFSAKPADAVTDGKLDPAAKPFTGSFGAGRLPSFGEKILQQENSKEKAEAAPGAPGLPLSEAFSGRSIDSNMSISPVAGSGSANINPFTAVDEVAAQPATSGTSLPALFPPATTAASSGPASNFAFGAAAAASAATSGGGPDAASKPGLFASAGAFGGGSMPAFGGSAPTFGGSAPAFGASTSAPLFGAATSTPAFGQGTGAVSGTPAFGLGNGPASGAPFAFGSSQSSVALFGANNASSSVPSTTPASTDSGFNFGGSGPLTFGAGSSAASGGAATAAPTFGAPQQNAGILFGASASSGAEQPAGAFGSAMQGKAESAPAFGGGLNLFGGSSTPAFGAASAPTFGAGSAPAFGAASGSAPAFGAASGSAPTFGAALGSGPAFGGMPNFGAQSAPAFGAASAPAFGAASRAVPGTGFGFGGVFGAGQKQDDPFQAQPPFGSMHNQPAFGQSSAVPTFGAQPPGQAANPFGQPGAPAFGMGANQQQPQPGAGNGFAAPGSGLAGNSAGSMTLGMEEQKQGGGNMARRKFKAKRPNK